MKPHARACFDRFHRESNLDLRPKSTRRKVGRAAMQFATENRHKFQTKEQLRLATIEHLQSGQEASDDEYGSFILSFIIGPIISWMVGRMIDWVWNNMNDESSASTPSESPGAEELRPDPGAQSIADPD